jgi:hypothetical protein
MPDMPAVRLGVRFRQGAAAGHSPGHRLRRSVPPADTRQRLRGDGHGGPLQRPVGRTSPVQCDRLADGYGPGPGRRAAKRRTPPAPSVRPCVRSAGHGQPRGLHVLALTGQDGNAHAPFGQPQPLPALGPVRRNHLHRARCRNLREPGPVRCPRGRVRRPPWTPRSDRLSDTASPSYPAGHRPLHPARHGETGSDADMERTNDTAGVRTSSIATTTRRPARTRQAPLWGRRLRLGNQGRPGDGKTASATITTTATRRLLAVAPPSKPRLGALPSCVGFGWYEWRAMGRRKAEVCGVRLGGEC